MLAGMAIGIGGGAVIHGQQAKVAPAYIIAEVEVKDVPAFQKYAAKVPETLAPFGHDIVRGGKTESLEGEPPKRIVVIAFDSMDKARAWYNSPAYDAIKSLRIDSTKSRLFLVEGLPAQ